MKSYPVFTSALCDKLQRYLKNGGSLFLSGSYIGSDGQNSKEIRDFTEEVLKYKYDGSARICSSDEVTGLNMQFRIYREPNAQHYAALAPDAILPSAGKAFSAFAFADGQGAGVAFKGKTYRTLCMSFPFECIQETDVRHRAMQAILSFLCK